MQNIEEISIVAPVTNNETDTNVKKTTKFNEDELISLSEYSKILKAELPKEIFLKNPKRIGWAFFFLLSNAAMIYTIVEVNPHWAIKLLCSIVIGTFTACGALLAHELLHGSIFKSKFIQDFFGFFLLAPFVVPPTYWRFWHNYLHHGNTQLLYKDPDAFPTRSIWKRSKFMKALYPFTPGSGNPVSYLYFLYWFPFQSVMNLLYFRFKTKMWDRMDHSRVNIEFILQVVLIASYIYFIGSKDILFLLVIPFCVQNYTPMSYISTNHNLSPYTKVNDPLVNSLSVTNFKLLEAIHLQFGYHTEHHIFPKMPMNNAKLVSAKLKEMYPNKYQIMPKFKALVKLYSTPRVYKDRTTLVCPKTNKEFKTLGT